jgi:hypothetical protein
MIDKPITAAEYSPEYVDLVKKTCLYLATVLGDFQNDLVIVGGLAPTLLIPEGKLSDEEPPHVGTTDLDVGLHIALLGGHRYEGLTERLRRVGFKNDINEEGKETRQRWINNKYGPAIKVDFLIQPLDADDEGGKLRNIEKDFAADIIPGLHLAFRDRVKVAMTGVTIAGEKASREIWVCGPGAFLILKALAFKLRGVHKDAYDIYFVLKNYGTGVEDIHHHLAPLIGDDVTSSALEILNNEFADPDFTGPRRAAEFLYGSPNPEFQADLAGFVRQLLSMCGQS